MGDDVAEFVMNILNGADMPDNVNKTNTVMTKSERSY